MSVYTTVMLCIFVAAVIMDVHKRRQRRRQDRLEQAESTRAILQGARVQMWPRVDTMHVEAYVDPSPETTAAIGRIEGELNRMQWERAREALDAHRASLRAELDDDVSTLRVAPSQILQVQRRINGQIIQRRLRELAVEAGLARSDAE